MVWWVILIHGLKAILVVDTEQSVKYGGFLSEWSSVEIGVPQGSILGPLLFSIFVNDLPAIVEHANVNMYADDTELFCCGEDLQWVEGNLQSDLNRIQHWLKLNWLQLNISKSVIMLIGTWQNYGIAQCHCLLMVRLLLVLLVLAWCDCGSTFDLEITCGLCVKEDKIYVVCIKSNEIAPRSSIISVISIFCFAHF